MAVKCEAQISKSKGVGYTIKSDAATDPPINEWPHKWEKGTLTYRLNNLSLDIEKAEHQRRAVTVSLRVWQLRIKDLKFKRTYNRTDPVDFNISFKPQSFFDRESILAHAWFPGQGDISGDIEINDRWDWVTHSKISDIGHPPLIPVLIHEVGHGLGLVHDKYYQGSIMYPSFNLGKTKNDLGPRDVERIQKLYGKRNISQRLLDYFKRRRDAGWDFD